MRHVCPYPGCDGKFFVELRAVQEYKDDIRRRAKKHRAGEQVICVKCFRHVTATYEGLDMMIPPKGNPQVEDLAPEPMNGAKRRTAARFADLGNEP